MSTRARYIAFAVVCMAAALGITAVILGAVTDQGGSDYTVTAVRPIQEGDTLIVDKDRSRHAAAFGRMAVIPAGGGPRRVTNLRCERVAYASGTGICLALTKPFPTRSYSARFFDARQRVRGAVSVEGSPSRARMSPGGRFAASTTFVSGHSYASAGEFSTRTVIYDARRPEALVDLEQFTVTQNGRRLSSPDFNFWGVTFDGDSGRFYATLATGPHRYLISGDVWSKRAEVVREGVECPSLSPDGTRLVFKARVGDPFQWRLHVLDLRSGRETELPTDRSIDDQAEWLDGQRVAYGVDEVTMVVDTDGQTPPRRLLNAGGSPGIAR